MIGNQPDRQGTFYQRLCQVRETGKLALTTCMRKLLAHFECDAEEWQGWLVPSGRHM